MWTYQNEHNMLLNFPGFLSILLLQTSKTDNNALVIDAIYNHKLKKHNLVRQTALPLKFSWPAIMTKQRECILGIVQFLPFCDDVII
jgi:hypothetical protein